MSVITFKTSPEGKFALRRTRKQLIADADKFASAQEDMAGRAREDSEHWHYVALADLLREMAYMLKEETNG
jgi:hypothetical protein